MQRAITAFFQDEAGDWAARLDCHHAQHTRHDPPFVNRPWVLDPAAREARVGEMLECLKCERLELPGGLESYRRTPQFEAKSTPKGLRAEHNTKAGVWGRINVESGTLTYVTLGQARQEFTVTRDAPGIIAPLMKHFVVPHEGVSFHVEFLRPPE